MSAPSTPDPAAVRPADYWDIPNPVIATLVNIKGQRRRGTVQQMLECGEPVYSEYWEAALRRPSLSSRDRRFLAAQHGTWLGGEELPDYLPGELEIARIILHTCTLDVISIRARRELRGTFRSRRAWRYRMVDEHGVTYTITPGVSIEPLSQAALVRLIDTAGSPGYPADGRPLGDRLRDGFGPEEGEAFVEVESLFYPELAEHFAAQARAWGERHTIN